MQVQETVGEKQNSFESFSYTPKETTKCILVLCFKSMKIYNIASGYDETKQSCLPHWIGVWKLKNKKL